MCFRPPPAKALPHTRSTTDAPNSTALRRLGKTAWEMSDVGGGILESGLMATAGGLIFYANGDGAFIAADAKNGKLLWHFNTGQSWKAGPRTYTVGGDQYIGMAGGSTILAFSLR